MSLSGIDLCTLAALKVEKEARTCSCEKDSREDSKQDDPGTQAPEWKYVA